jgi:HEAT repeat
MLAKHGKIIEELAFPYKASDAYRALLDLGIQALPAVRTGLRHDNPDVRLHCCRFLDRYLSPDTALHTLACDRCKEETCRPEEADVLPKAMKMLQSDPEAHVRAMAIEVVGQFVHANALAAAAISAARQNDENSTVRKKAGWYLPGGPAHRRTKPKLGVVVG